MHSYNFPVLWSNFDIKSFHEPDRNSMGSNLLLKVWNRVGSASWSMVTCLRSSSDIVDWHHILRICETCQHCCRKRPGILNDPHLLIFIHIYFICVRAFLCRSISQRSFALDFVREDHLKQQWIIDPVVCTKRVCAHCSALPNLPSQVTLWTWQRPNSAVASFTNGKRLQLTSSLLVCQEWYGDHNVPWYHDMVQLSVHGPEASSASSGFTNFMAATEAQKYSFSSFRQFALSDFGQRALGTFLWLAGQVRRCNANLMAICYTWFWLF